MQSKCSCKGGGPTSCCTISLDRSPPDSAINNVLQLLIHCFLLLYIVEQHQAKVPFQLARSLVSSWLAAAPSWNLFLDGCVCFFITIRSS